MNKTVADVLAEYKETALHRRHHFERLCAANKELSQIEDELKILRFEQLGALLSGEGATAALEELEAKRDEIIKDSIRFPRYACEICGDTGSFEGNPCNCLLEKIYAQCYGAVYISSLPQGFDKFKLDAFDDKNMLPVGYTQRGLMKIYKKNAEKYINDFPGNQRKNILMMGKAGLGKSYLINCMAVEAKKKGADVLLMRAGELHSLFFAHRMGEDVDLSFLHNAKLLLVDDLGAEPITQNVSVEYLYSLINKRIEKGLHTVYATNVENLQKRYDDRIASRLEYRDYTDIYLFGGSDLRMR